VLDDGAASEETLLVSGGRRGFDVELTPADLVTVLDATVAPIGREDLYR
jgi:Cys-tRNA(Pro)/Cys-tRNA(Cys) deacylase